MTLSKRTLESALGIGCIALGALMAAGAIDIPSEAGYQGVGPNFLPWLVASVLMICGALMLWQALRQGGWVREDAEGAPQGDWLPFVWISAAILLNAATITSIGFILSCTLAFVLAVRGFHQSQGCLDLSPAAWLRDTAIGFAISAPVFWLFTMVLGINLPGLTNKGWI